MAAKNSMKIESKFRAVKGAAQDAIEDAIGKALNHGEATAEKRLERIDDTKGYELPIDIRQTSWPLGGKIYYPQWYGHFFEYGTVFISASPFMRPASTKMRGVFKKEMGDNFERFIRRKASVASRSAYRRKMNP